MSVQSFKDERLEGLLAGKVPGKGFPSQLARVTQRKLVQMDSATSLADLRDPPGNQLEALKGDRDGQHSIRVNDQFRLCFIWTDAGPTEVEFVDYH
jgi:proteic killer suppression protein